MSTASLPPSLPDEVAVREADVALRRIKRYLSSHTEEQVIRVVVGGDPDETLAVPRNAIEILARILTHMAAGQGVSVVPGRAELTTQQAADLLNVSRPYLISLLESGKIAFRRVGKHRRVRADSLMEYKRKDDHERRTAADELSELNQDMGLY
ncbi:excisionase family DNA-binding protein [Microlunatus sp. GCM10028923]|uniref:excisionase family DNA-binding protein n=1 Tax=Microlunatus sp. GCM10028923 TaxID=3273400 RepID=UPI00360FF181